MLLRFLPHYAADGGGSGAEDDDPDERVRSEDVIARAKDDKDAIARLGRELDRNEDRRFKQRDAKRALRAEIDTLKAAQPADGGRVLTKDEAKAFDEFQAFGKKPSEIKAELDGATTATQELAALRRKTQLHDVQALTGFDPDVLEDIGAGWEFVTKDEQADGKPVKIVYVKEGDQEQRIDQHPKVMKFMPSLKPAQQQADPPAPRNTSFIQQHGGTAPSGDMAAQFIAAQEERRKAQPNPLLKGA